MHRLYRLADIVSDLGGQLLQDEAEGGFRHIATDTRSLLNGTETVFLALVSPSNDGNKYVEEAWRKGVRHFIVSHDQFSRLPDSSIILVPDTLAALQTLAALHRENFNLPVVGITGSNGKTTLKEWLWSILHRDRHVVRSPRSYNSQIGVPLSVWQLEENHELAIFEAGVSRKGEMGKLQPIIRPQIGIFTNIGSAHGAGFASTEEKIDEKLALFRESETLIYCASHRDVADLVNEKRGEGFFSKDICLLSWGWEGEGNYLTAWHENDHDLGLRVDGENHLLHTPFTEIAYQENALHLYALLHFLGYGHEAIQAHVMELHPIDMRLEMKGALNGCTLLNDSYNSDLQSLGVALHALAQNSRSGRRTVILSDIRESGQKPENLYVEVAAMLHASGVQRLIGIGQDISRQSHLFSDLETWFYPSTDDFLAAHPLTLFREEGILLKGSRVFEFERIAQRLQQKAHGTVLEINLNSLVHNLNVYRSLLRPGVGLMCMVKASSYGGGAHEIALALQHQKVDYLAVAYADEGVYLRQQGVSLPIMVMSPEEDAFLFMLQYGLEPEIYSFRTLQAYLNASAGIPDPPPIHIKLDTGMHRLGFLSQEVERLGEMLKRHTRLRVASIFSHLASADVPPQDDFTKLQARLFEKGCEVLAGALGYAPRRHILNSSGIARFPQHQYEMARLGIGLYGIDPADIISDRLEPVNSLKTYISQIKSLPAGSSVGYSRKAYLSHPTRVATICIGYADGFQRALGNGRLLVYVNGRPAPTLGNVCMDMTMIDLGDVPAEEGDEVVIFNEEFGINRLAEALGTIPYEVLTGISGRVKRVYYRE